MSGKAKYYQPHLRGKPIDLRKQLFSSGEIATILGGLAPRTVCKYIDRGLLVGHRLPVTGPNGGRRVVARADLVRFMRSRGFPLGGLSELPQVLYVGHDVRLSVRLADDTRDALQVVVAPDGFAAGAAVESSTFACAIVDMQMGRWEALGIIRRIRQHARHRDTPILAVVNEDEADDPAVVEAGATECWRRPFDPVLLTERLQLLAIRK